MAFTEALKLTVKRKAHFSCCLCHTLGVEIHHIVPQAEGGSDTEENAAPLCPSCHETYGANPQKRKFIREAREFWYELCEKRYASDVDRLERILTIIQETASKDDLSRVLDKMFEFQQSLDNSLTSVMERERYVWQIDELQQRVLQVESDLQDKSLTLLQHRKRDSVTQLGAQIAVRMANERSSELDANASEAYGQAMRILMGSGNLSPEEFVRIFQSAFKDESAPENEIHRALYYLSQHYKCFIQLIVALNISSLVVPFILKEYDANPDRSIKDIQKSLAERIRAGELDVRNNSDEMIRFASS
jgi:hypothetical protein